MPQLGLIENSDKISELVGDATNVIRDALSAVSSKKAKKRAREANDEAENESAHEAPKLIRTVGIKCA